jgi:RHS repeat-associated protein
LVSGVAAVVLCGAAVVSLALAAPSLADPSCTITWTGAAGDGLWSTAANWSSASVPGASDVVCIGSGETVAVAGGSAAAATVLADGATVRVSAGSLALSGTSNVSRVGTLLLSGGVLTGTATVTVTTGLTWSDGVMSGSGSTVIAAGAAATVAAASSTSSLVLDGRRLANQGSLTFDCSTGSDPTGLETLIEGDDAAQIDNSGTLTLENATAPWYATPYGETGCDFQRADSSVDLFQNDGTLVIGDYDRSNIGWQFANADTASVKTTTEWGGLILFGGESPSARLGGDWQGDGYVEFAAGGAYQFTADATVVNLDLEADAAPAVCGSPCGSGWVDFVDWLAGSATAPSLTAGAVSWPTATVYANGTASIGDGSAEASIENLTADSGEGGTATATLTEPASDPGGQQSITGTVSAQHGGIVDLNGKIDAPEGAVDAWQGTVNITGAGSSFSSYQFFPAGGVIDQSAPATVWAMSGTGTITGGSTTTVTGVISGGVLVDRQTVVNQGSLDLGLIYGEAHAEIDNYGTIFASGTGSGDVGAMVAVAGVPRPLLVNESGGSMERQSNDPSGPANFVGWNFENDGYLQAGAFVFAGAAGGEYGNLNPASTYRSDPSCTSKPVDCATGNQFETHTDFSIPGIGLGLQLARTYNSQAAVSASAAGAFGYGWSASYSDHLVIDSSDATATVVQANGSTVPFAISGSSFTPAPWVEATLAAHGDGSYTYTLPDQTSMLFDATGRLVSESDRYASTTSLSYNGSGELVSVSDASGRSITFAHNSDGTVSSASDPAGNTVHYGYTSGNLTSVTNQAGATWTFGYDSAHQLTSETDPRGGTVTTAYDSSRRVISQTDALNRTTTWNWATPGETVITDPNGNVITDTFDSQLRLTSTTDATGTPVAATTSYGYDTNGNLTSVTDPNGHTTTYTYDSADNRTSRTDALDRTTTWTHDPQRDVTSSTDPSGLTTTYTYTDGKLTEVSRPVAETSQTQATHYTYTDPGDPAAITSVENPDGDTTSYGYDSNGNVISVTDGDGNETTYTYDADGRRTSTTSPRGNLAGANTGQYTTTDTYNVLGELATTTATPSPLDTSWPGHELASYALPSVWATPAEVVSGPDGNVWLTEYDGGRIAKVTPAGTVTEYSTGSGSQPSGLVAGPHGDLWFTAGSNTVGTVSPSGTITDYTIDAGSWASAITIATGASGTVRVAEPGNLAIATLDGSGTVTARASTIGNPWDITAGPDGSDYFSDAHGATSYIGVISGSGSVSEYAMGSGHAVEQDPGTIAYDASAGSAGTVWFVDSGAGGLGAFDVASHSYSYYPAPADATAIDKLTVARDGTVWFTENTTAGIVGQLDPATGRTTEYPVDGGGDQMYGITQGPDGNLWLTAENETTGHSIIDRVALAPTTTASFTYDADGNQLTATNADGQTTRYTHDADNELTATTLPDGTTTSTSYDSDGNILAQTNGRGNTTNYTYNALNQRITSTDPDNRTTNYTYDGAGNLTSLTDAAGRTTTYSYDRANELTAVSYSDGTTHGVTYDYNALGGPTSMTDATGTTSYSYDTLGRLTSTTDGHGDTIAYGYDLADNQTQVTYPAAHTVTRSYDNAENLTSVADWLGNTTSFSYDPDGNLTTTSFAGNVGQQDRYTYDNADTLAATTTTANGATLASLADTYDQAGNLTRETSTGLATASQSYAYNALDQLVSNNTAAYSYDAASNATTLAGASTPLFYDNANQLTTGPQGTYSYNSLGQRTGLTTSATSTSYGWNQAGELTSNTGGPSSLNLAYTYDGNGLLQTRTNNTTTSHLTWDPTSSLLLIDNTTNIIYGPNDLPIEQIATSGTPAYYHHDQLGSTRLLTNTTGTNLETISYTPYGTPTTTSGTPTTNLLYASQYTDPTSGLNYMRARWYDPTTAQFMSVDPAVAVTGATYSYAGDNPADFADPTGQNTCLPLVGCISTPSWNDIGNAVAGFGDTMTFGATKLVRQQFGIDNVDYCSSAYSDGGWGGLGLTALIPGEGEAELVAEGDGLVNLASEERTNHILNGDETGGGHLWPGLSGKTPFPSDWSPGQIMHAISDIATDPPAWANAVRQGSRTILTGVRDGVDIRVIVDNDTGDIVTGYPTSLARNP